MSSTNNGTIALLTEIAITTNGVVACLTLAYTAIRTWRKFNLISSALDKVYQAKTVPISDLRSFITSSASESESGSADEKLVVVRGLVEEKSTKWWSFSPDVLVHQETGLEAVVLQERNGWEELEQIFRWTRFLPTTLGKLSKYHRSTSIRTVPFILAGSGPGPHSFDDYVIVNLDGSTHSIPLLTVFNQLKLTYIDFADDLPWVLLEPVLCPVGLIEEKILPVGAVISAVGICTLQDGYPQIKASEELPYFLSCMTKDEMVVDLDHKMRFWFLSSIILGSLSLGVLGYIITRNWRRWKECRQQSRNDGFKDDSIGNGNTHTE